MKALTVCQPYAHLIMLGLKPIENRTWYTAYRGQLYIHAGKSRDWLTVNNGKDRQYGIPLDDLAFGAIICIATLIDCVTVAEVKRGVTYPHLKNNEHASGPWCWILGNIERVGPWPWRGSRRLFDVHRQDLDSLRS
jgi:activating signal cointegrator 1